MQKEGEVVIEKEEGGKGSSKIKLGEIRRLMVLAKPEQKTIALAIGLVSTCAASQPKRSLTSLLCGWQLFVSSSVSLSIPFTIGRIIDLFSGSAAGLPISVPTAAALLAVFFAIGAAASE